MVGLRRAHSKASTAASSLLCVDATDQMPRPLTRIATLRPRPAPASGAQPTQAQINQMNNSCTASLAVFAALFVPLAGAWVSAVAKELAGGPKVLLPSLLATVTVLSSFLVALLALRYQPAPPWGVGTKGQAAHLRNQAGRMLNKRSLVDWAWRLLIASVPCVLWMAIDVFA